MGAVNKLKTLKWFDKDGRECETDLTIYAEKAEIKPKLEELETRVAELEANGGIPPGTIIGGGTI